MGAITRRGFHHELLGSLLTYSLLETVFSRGLLADSAKTAAAAWLNEIDQLGRDLKGASLTQLAWQDQMEALFSRVDLPDLLRLIDFDKLTADLKFRERGELSLRPQFPKVEGLPTELVFGHQVFALTKGRSVVPHGHDNMATAFLILGGDCHGRHYDRIEDDKTSMLIQPTIDRGFTVAECSTVSDHRDNVHWFTATSERAFIFNIHVVNLEAGRSSGRVYVDPNGAKLADGRIRARKLKAAEAIKLYG